MVLIWAFKIPHTSRITSDENSPPLSLILWGQNLLQPSFTKYCQWNRWLFYDRLKQTLLVFDHISISCNIQRLPHFFKSIPTFSLKFSACGKHTTGPDGVRWYNLQISHDSDIELRIGAKSGFLWLASCGNFVNLAAGGWANCLWSFSVFLHVFSGAVVISTAQNSSTLQQSLMSGTH